MRRKGGREEVLTGVARRAHRMAGGQTRHNVPAEIPPRRRNGNVAYGAKEGRQTTLAAGVEGPEDNKKHTIGGSLRGEGEVLLRRESLTESTLVTSGDFWR